MDSFVACSLLSRRIEDGAQLVPLLIIAFDMLYQDCFAWTFLADGQCASSSYFSFRKRLFVCCVQKRDLLRVRNIIGLN
jgi:hypothetical protein